MHVKQVYEEYGCGFYMSLKQLPNSLLIYFMTMSSLYLLFINFKCFQLHMLFRSILSVMSQELQWAVVVTLEESRKGKEEQFETVVPCKWLSRDEKWLWWPPSLRVKSKRHCGPDVTTWKKFKVLKIKIEVC